MTNYQTNTLPCRESVPLPPLPDHQPASDCELIKAVSGYGRELFFSNIIDYIAKHRPEAVAMALRDFLPGDGPYEAARESSRMDLVFFSRDEDGSRTPVLVIENKRGSIATARQLERYTGKITGIRKRESGRNSGCSFLLVSPHLFDKDVADKAGWRFMGYSELGEKLSYALNSHAEKNPDYQDSLEFRLLNAAIGYMPHLEEESTLIYDGVKYDTKCSELRQKGDSADTVKLRYCAATHMLKVRLEEEGVNGVDCSFDPGSTLPMVSLEIKDLLTRGEDKLSFSIQFQGGVLAIGFCRKGHFDDLKNAEKKERRKDMWRIHNFAEILKQITNRPEGFEDYKGTGYMTSGYILPMYRIDVRERTVGEIVETMCRYAKGALAYGQNLPTNS